MMKDVITSAVNDVLEQMVQDGLAQTRDIKFAVEHPTKLEHGEYSVNAAMQLAKVLRKPPMVVAEQLKNSLIEHPKVKTAFSKVEVATPGFINFHINWEEWALATTEMPAAPSNIKVIIEHTSINPNKSAHIGHLRNSCIGDTVARMLKKTGCQIEIHNYIDDLGNQLADTVVGILHTSSKGPFERFGDFCWETYSKINRKYKEVPELEAERTAVLHELEQGNSNLAWLGLLTAERIVREHLEEMKQFDIRYDVLVWESSIVKEGFWNEAFEMLQGTPIFGHETQGKLAGCWVLKQTEDSNHPTEDEFQADKVLVRSNGILTYTAKDIAYHLWKFGVLNKDFRYKKFADGVWTTDRSGVKRKIGHANTVINVIDHRQEYPQKMVKQALRSLGFEKQSDNLKHISYGVVSLSRKTARELGVDISDGSLLTRCRADKASGLRFTIS